jgi:S-formylglutathione hydrolase
MRFAVYLPPAAEKGPVPALYWLSGLTCTEENFSVKAGAQRYAAELGLALVIPDTSPRGVNIPGEDAQMDVGTGAGFYVNATEAPWAAHYRMYDYIRDELPAVVNANLPVDPARKSISGHSMGGHGAIIIGIGNPQSYRSVSAFAPIASASQSAWGQHALTALLGHGPPKLERVRRSRRDPRQTEPGTSYSSIKEWPTRTSSSCFPTS